ncbi:MAG TPA: tRNA epoxyqueuosine(34) reductase QueG, partial [Bacteroidales bacterium]|nr:tRNA epoxyqueuosine(34) reductase QueG [Bacteroidales bacterium]
KSGDYRVSQYAAGKDYHQVIRGKLRQLLSFVQEAVFSCNGRAFTDSAPLLERAWAVQAGLGWIGKNSMLISRRLGSYVFVGELVTDQTLEYDKPSGESFCGDCNRCIKACPTSAINNNSTIDARRCISYLTVEHHGSLPEGVRNKYSRWIFGCDICQEVCPWNRFAIPHSESEFSPLPNAPKSKHEWNSITKEEFEFVFRHSSLKRAGFEAIKRNIAFLE